MDLYLLSYLIQQGRYHVAPEIVAEAILRWLEPELRLVTDRGMHEPIRVATPTGLAPEPQGGAGP